MVLREDRVRELWQEQLGRPIDDDAWDSMKSVYLGVDETELIFSTPQEALDAFAETDLRRLHAWGDLGRPADTKVSTKPPRGWYRYQERMFTAAFGLLIDEARRSLGLTRALLSPEEVAGFLRERGTACRRGDHSTISFFDYESRQVEFILHDESDSALTQLHKLAQLIALSTNISEFDAVEYILTGIGPYSPWIEAFPLAPLRGRFEAGMTIYVGSLDARPDEVAAAYTQARNRTLSDPLYASEHSFRRLTDGGDSIIAFCRPLRESGTSWGAIAFRWNEEHPGQEFKDGDTLSRVYRRHLTKAKGGETK